MSAKSAKKSETKHRRHKMKVVCACYPIPLYQELCAEADAEGITISDLLRQIARRHRENALARTTATQIK